MTHPDEIASANLQGRLWCRILDSHQSSDAAPRLLILEVWGDHAEGSDGNLDSNFLVGQLATAQRMIWWHQALLVDLSALRYSSGDAIIELFQPEGDRPCAFILGPACAGGILSLLNDGEEARDDIFRTRAAALDWLGKAAE